MKLDPQVQDALSTWEALTKYLTDKGVKYHQLADRLLKTAYGPQTGRL